MSAVLHSSFRTVPISHRGYHDKAKGVPENSPASWRAAMAAGYGIECDLQPSRDGVPMVFHDYDMPRLTGQEGLLSQRTAAELAEIPLLGGDEGVPTLADLLRIVDGKVPLLIEVKDQDLALGPNVGKLEAAAAEVLKGYKGPAAVMSFNPHSVAEMARLLPDMARGITSCSYQETEWWKRVPAERLAELRAISDYDRVGASFISHEAGDLGRARVAELKAKGAAILCWTIRSPEAEAAARKVADNVTFEGYAAPLRP